MEKRNADEGKTQNRTNRTHLARGTTMIFPHPRFHRSTGTRKHSLAFSVTAIPSPATGASGSLFAVLKRTGPCPVPRVSPSICDWEELATNAAAGMTTAPFQQLNTWNGSSARSRSPASLSADGKGCGTGFRAGGGSAK